MANTRREPLSRFTRNHSAEQLIQWAKQLRYFYLFGDFESGHVWMPEMLQCRILFGDTEDFLQKIGLLTELEPTPPELPWMRYPIHFLPQYLVPGECQVKNCPLEGVFCFISVGDGFFDIMLHGDGKSVRQGIHRLAVAAARKLEAHLESIGLAPSVDHSISAGYNCISAANYPQEFL
jgi:hypothetical protein